MPPKSRKYDEFIVNLSSHGNIAVAAHDAKLKISDVIAYKNVSKEFSQDWHDAIVLARGRLEVAAYKAALAGYSRTLHSSGKLTVDKDGNTVMINEYDTKLLTYMIERNESKDAHVDTENVLPRVVIRIAADQADGTSDAGSIA